MKNKTYTVKFFKDLINKSSTSVEMQREPQEDDSQNHDLGNFRTFLFSSSQNRI
jgi:hypothetical protein